MSRVPLKIVVASMLLLILAAVACGEDKTKTTSSEPPKKVQKTARDEGKDREEGAELEHKLFPSAAQALREVLSEKKPRAVGFGEFHQQNNTRDTLSALERFSGTILPVLAGQTSDLVVETWISKGNCGETEKAVTAEVDVVTKRPKATENETIKLLKQAKAFGIQPHILEVECGDYDKVLQADGGVDYLGLLELVAHRLEDKGKAILTLRARADRGATGPKNSSQTNKLVAIYCGAIHNDVAPAKEWKSISFAPGILKATGGRYLEVDLYVPEFIENAKSVQSESWYPLFRRLSSPDKALLIKLSESSYIIVFRKGVTNPGA